MKWFENRELKKEIERLDGELEQAKKEIVSVQGAKESRDVRVTALKSELLTVKSEAAKTAKLVRKQTGADLLVNALRELGVVPPEKEGKKIDYFKKGEMLQRQMAAARSQQNSGSSYEQSSALGGLLGSGFR